MKSKKINDKKNRIYSQTKTSSLIVYGISDRGRVRPTNEDSIYIDSDGRFILLADGIGGHVRGAEASETVIKIFCDHFEPDILSELLKNDDITDTTGNVPEEISRYKSLIFSATKKSNSFLNQKNKELNNQRGMGTTIVGLIFINSIKHLVWFHIGDSRLYRWRNNELSCLTEDHSAYFEWKKAGKIGRPPKSNIITRAIGPVSHVMPDIKWESWKQNDSYILCSDGLTNMVTDEQIEDTLLDESNPEFISKKLLNTANNKGGKDNISVISICLN